jgi:hypothetical protein
MWPRKGRNRQSVFARVTTSTYALLRLFGLVTVNRSELSAGIVLARRGTGAGEELMYASYRRRRAPVLFGEAMGDTKPSMKDTTPFHALSAYD